MQDVLHWDLRAIGFVVAGALFWLQYFDLKDRLNPEPRRLLFAAFLLGWMAAVMGLIAYRTIEWLGGPDDPGIRKSDILFYCLVLVGPIEEGAKFLVSRIFIFRWADFDEPIDGLVYSSAVAIGFASMESLLYSQFLPWPDQLARSITAPLTQSLFSSLWGFGAGYAYFHDIGRKTRFAIFGATLLLAILMHGVYDYVLLAEGATYIASGIVLILWLSMILMARRIVKR